MTRIQLLAMQAKLFEAHARHLSEAHNYKDSDPIWTARACAAHICLSLMEAVQAAVAVTPEEDPYEGK